MVSRLKTGREPECIKIKEGRIKVEYTSGCSEDKDEKVASVRLHKRLLPCDSPLFLGLLPLQKTTGVS